MTDKEAIEVLKLNNPFMAGKDKETLSKAIDKAVEALEYKIGCEYCKHWGDVGFSEMCMYCHIGDDRWVRKGE